MMKALSQQEPIMSHRGSLPKVTGAAQQQRAEEYIHKIEQQRLARRMTYEQAATVTNVRLAKREKSPSCEQASSAGVGSPPPSVQQSPPHEGGSAGVENDEIENILEQLMVLKRERALIEEVSLTLTLRALIEEVSLTLTLRALIEEVSLTLTLRALREEVSLSYRCLRLTHVSVMIITVVGGRT